VLASYKEAFSVFDKDGSGTVSTSELGEIMSALGQNLSAEELDGMVKEVDADGSGEIDFNEFCACMLKAKEGGATAPKLAVVVEENGLLSGLKNFFGRLFNRGPSAEEIAAAEAAAEAAAAAPAKKAADETDIFGAEDVPSGAPAPAKSSMLIEEVSSDADAVPPAEPPADLDTLD
jgi:hypothetical protein